MAKSKQNNQNLNLSSKPKRKKLSNADYKAIRVEALAHVNSVKYYVSLRWVFYRMFQDGKYIKYKSDWKMFKSLISFARKNFLDGWKPNTLTDDTRKIIWRGGGFKNKKEWFDFEKNNSSCSLNKIHSQDYYLMIWFEAKAMANQFQYYTENIPLLAFGGDVSIPMKWKLAKELERAKEEYDKPIVVLYFGDCDTKGEMIYKSALKDIREWCDVEFEFIPCGLTLQQALALRLPTNPEKPNQYQWEALSDEQAKALIEDSVKPYQEGWRWAKIKRAEKRIIKEYQKRLSLQYIKDKKCWIKPKKKTKNKK